jgi:hypothetical protein
MIKEHIGEAIERVLNVLLATDTVHLVRLFPPFQTAMPPFRNRCNRSRKCPLTLVVSVLESAHVSARCPPVTSASSFSFNSHSKILLAAVPVDLRKNFAGALWRGFGAGGTGRGTAWCRRKPRQQKIHQKILKKTCVTGTFRHSLCQKI